MQRAMVVFTTDTHRAVFEHNIIYYQSQSELALTDLVANTNTCNTYIYILKLDTPLSSGHIYKDELFIT